MIKVGILGDIGSGKSYVAKKFGYQVFDADLEVGDEGTAVSLDRIAEAETEAETTEVNSDDSETTNS